MNQFAHVEWKSLDHFATDRMKKKARAQIGKINSERHDAEQIVFQRNIEQIMHNIKCIDCPFGIGQMYSFHFRPPSAFSSYCSLVMKHRTYLVFALSMIELYAKGDEFNRVKNIKNDEQTANQ